MYVILEHSSPFDIITYTCIYSLFTFVDKIIYPLAASQHYVWSKAEHDIVMRNVGE